MIDYAKERLCINSKSIHQSGISNGGILSYSIIAKLSDIFASIAPVAASPLLGYGDLPGSPLSIIDLHGTRDTVVPNTLTQALGLGPYDSLVSSNDGFYYEKKSSTIKYVDGFNCTSISSPWKTDMDGVKDWSCDLWTVCIGGMEIVNCTGSFGHNYPFGAGKHTQAARIIWNFMKTHEKQDI
ncbi:uncharacterized protein LOC111711737 isoform X2 [Eurytemora carolleeae]|uniref:uncharacterized protein LOC111711737 isoform X2 n=1 Tax=Eurytemora carolleeae TaxID=1294199 RepID=UPI000C794547|nr:uncharacterized protein LOC111711737 isoform X2 [Eurytemora carolleeae]|eukprot:XP_023341932.1 uncharacterized protein LOC111711737 isoform X2 [Eurytemora affinis]